MPLRENSSVFARSLAACVLGTAVLLAGASASAQDRSPRSEPAAPWSGPSLAARNVPPIYLSVWRKAENRRQCAPLVFADAHREPRIGLRRATFSGGWAVAYDTPAVRSAFGIAGSGSNAGDPGQYRFPHRLAWSDGSWASYGLEGGTGPKQLAYLTVAGQGCLYNVWSTRGRKHLERLLLSLRKVDVSPGKGSVQPRPKPLKP